MALTIDDKAHLVRLVKSAKKTGTAKADAILNIHNAYGYETSTVKTYWETFNE